MMMIRRLMILLALPAAVAAASAQTAPAGWDVKATEQAWIATSPAHGKGDRVRIVFYPVVKASGEIEAWFDGQVARRTKDLGMMIYREPEIVRQTSPSVAPLLRRAATLSRFGQIRSNIAMNFGYETREGRQFVQIIMPASPGKPSAAYLAAVEHVATAWAAGVVFRQSAGAPATPRHKGQ